MKLYFLLFATVLGAMGQTAQTGTANSNPSSAGGSAAFLGTVVDAAGKPLEGVHVTLTVFGERRLFFGRNPVAIYSSLTNEKGRFSIPEVPPRSYEVALEKRGYLMAPSEASNRGPVSGDHVQLKAGERFTDVVLHMARRAIITGRLLGEYGEPLAGARVSAKPAGSIEGGWETAMTDDHGEFRLSLLPGKYLVAADASSHMPADAHPSGNKGNYQFTYFPGVATDKEASLVEALPGGVTGDIDFKAIWVATYTVKVEVTGIPESSGSLFIHYTGKEGSGSHSPEPPSHPNGAHAVEVEIDPETGEVKVDRYVMVDDLGQVLNPMIVNGQQHGGVAQGIGQALYEHAVYDRQSAQLVTGSFMDYVMPRADMLPNFDIALEEVPCKTNPIGVKGIGESGTIGAPPVVINAVIDALSPLGIDRIDMPATPGRVWEAIQATRTAPIVTSSGA